MALKFQAAAADNLNLFDRRILPVFLTNKLQINNLQLVTIQLGEVTACHCGKVVDGSCLGGGDQPQHRGDRVSVAIGIDLCACRSEEHTV